VTICSSETHYYNTKQQINQPTFTQSFNPFQHETFMESDYVQCTCLFGQVSIPIHDLHHGIHICLETNSTLKYSPSRADHKIQIKTLQTRKRWQLRGIATWGLPVCRLPPSTP